MFNIYTLGRKLKQSNLGGLRRLINMCYYDPKTLIIHKDNFDSLTVDGYVFPNSDQIDSVQRVIGNSWFNNVKSTDIVLDIGANTGAITIPLAHMADRGITYAVEPIFTDLLKKTIDINGLANIVILPFALGRKNGHKFISFGTHNGMANTRTFAQIKDLCGGHIDYFKCDCEGAEWDIELEDLVGIRELRFEFHIRRSNEQADRATLQKWYRWLDKNGYKYVISYGDEPGPCVPFSQCLLLNASRK